MARARSQRHGTRPILQNRFKNVNTPKITPKATALTSKKDKRKQQSKREATITQDFIKNETEEKQEVIKALKKRSKNRSNREIETICDYLRKIESFQRFCSEALIELINQMTLEKIPKG
jgi:hypothetical protein